MPVKETGLDLERIPGLQGEERKGSGMQGRSVVFILGREKTKRDIVGRFVSRQW